MNLKLKSVTHIVSLPININDQIINTTAETVNVTVNVVVSRKLQLHGIYSCRNWFRVHVYYLK